MPHDAPATPLARLVHHIARVVHGKHDAITLAVVGLAAEGHVLLEDVPGTGKTSLARALARSLDLTLLAACSSRPICCPSDVLGVSACTSPGDRSSSCSSQGPVFGHVVLADELNRTTPRTQSALLECMSDRRVSIDGRQCTSCRVRSS